MMPPALTVLIPSVNGPGDLEGCLEAVTRLGGDIAVEVLVVDRVGAPVEALVGARFPGARLLPVPPGTPIPLMRHAGFQAARGDAVAVIEDHVIVPSDWGRRLLDALAAGAEVVGGPVANAATGRLLDWATYLCEYSACMPPLPAGTATWLPGNNVAYRRELLSRFRSVTAEGKWENHLHDAMRVEGVTLVCLPDLVVGHKKHFGFGEYLSQRFLYSRSYAGARVAGRGPAHRLLFGAAALALPALMLVRIQRALAAKGVSGRRRLATLPFMLPFVLSWGIGEAVGYWFGAGNALARVR